MNFINTTTFVKRLFTVLWVMGLLLVTACRDKQVSDGQVTDIDLTSPAQKRLNMSEFVSGIQYIPLETSDDNLMGNVDQLLFAHNKIIIVDNKTASIFFFDDQGKYLYKIAKQGVGPEEYSEIDKVAVNSQEGVLYVLDRKKVLVYSLEGEFKEIIKLDFLAGDFIYMDHTLVFYCDYGQNPALEKDGQLPLLAIYHIDTAETRYSLYADASIGMTEVIDNHMLRGYSGRDEGTLTFPFSDYVYRLGTEGASPAYFVDFGEKNRTRLENHLAMLKSEQLNAEDCMEGRKGYPAFRAVSGCQESDSLLFVGFNNYSEYETGVYLWDKRSGKTLNGCSSEGWAIKNDIDGGYPLLPMALRGDKFYTVVPPFYLLDMEIEDPELKSIVEKMTREENPILMVSTVKIGKADSNR